MTNYAEVTHEDGEENGVNGDAVKEVPVTTPKRGRKVTVKQEEEEEAVGSTATGATSSGSSGTTPTTLTTPKRGRKAGTSVKTEDASTTTPKKSARQRKDTSPLTEAEDDEFKHESETEDDKATTTPKKKTKAKSTTPKKPTPKKSRIAKDQPEFDEDGNEIVKKKKRVKVYPKIEYDIPAVERLETTFKGEYRCRGRSSADR